MTKSSSFSSAIVILDVSVRVGNFFTCCRGLRGGGGGELDVGELGIVVGMIDDYGGWWLVVVVLGARSTSPAARGHPRLGFYII